MPTPPLSDEILLKSVECRARHASDVAAAAELGINDKALRNRLNRAAERGLSGFAPVQPGFIVKQISNKAADGSWVKQTREPGEEFEPLPGHVVKGESALVGPDGRIHAKWIKTREGDGPALEEVVAFLKGAFADVKPAGPVAAPAAPSEKLCTLIPCNDWHVRLLTWERETGVNWDLKIAERVIGESIVDVIERSPSSDLAVVLGGGDLMHADTDQNRTEKSGNVLDADGRHAKGIEVAQRLKVRTIDAALARNKHVIVRILKGNHDEYSAGAIAYFLLAWYRNEPRVTVDVDQSLYFWHRFGKVMLGATHGHTVKLQDMASIMAHRRAEDWGATKFRYCHGFHIHHHSKFASEGGGVISESHQAPIPPDAWHFGAGYLSGRSVQAITYHADFGEISRSRTAILDAEAA